MEYGEDEVLNSLLITNWEKYDESETLKSWDIHFYTSTWSLSWESSQILHRLRLNLSASTNYTVG